MFKKSTEITRGMEFRYMGGRIKVLTVSDNYVMLRKKGAMPFVMFWKRLITLPWIDDQ